MIRPLDSFRRWWTNSPQEPAVGPEVSQAPGEVAGNGNGNGNGKSARPAAGAAEPGEAPWLAQLDKAGIPRSLCYPTTTLARVLDQTAERFGDAVAVVYGATRWTYRELLAQVNRTAGGLSTLGIRKGDRVLFTLPNCPEMVTCFLAVQKLGAVVVNAGPLMGADDLATVMTMTAPRVVIGLDLHGPVLARAGKGSAVEHWVWVSLQAYQPVLKRLGYQYKLWQDRSGSGDKGQHVNLADLLAHAPARPPTVEPDPSRVAVLQATGGTTGTLKLAQLTHKSILANATQMSTWMNCRHGQDKFYAVLPMFHVYGLTTCMIAPVFMGSGMLLMTRFNAAEALELIRREKPTVLPVVPAIVSAMSDEIEKQEKKENRKAAKMDYVRLCFSGAAPLPVPAMERFTKLTGMPIIEGYGLTEASPVTHVNLPGKPRPGSIGLPMPDTRIRIVEVSEGGAPAPAPGSNGNGHLHGPAMRDVKRGEPGELLIAGPQIMLGYFSNPQQTAIALSTDEHGTTWLHTGDIARVDEEGFFYILDRKKDMIIRGGLKIFPQKVESVLRRHPRVTDVAVVGRADAVRTESVVAVCVVTETPAAVPEKGAAPQDKEQLRAADHKKLSDELKSLCREHLAPYEVPSSIEFVKELPRSPLGKLLKRELRKAPEVAADPARTSAAAIKAGSESTPEENKPGPGAPVNGKPTNGKKSEKPEKEAA